jgi:acyl-CoA thioester hydrolase
MAEHVREDGRMDLDLRVRYVDTDQMGVVHHGNYILWFEVGRTEFCRTRGFSYHDLEQSGYRLMITDLRCRYRKAVTYDEVVTVRTWIKDLKRRMVTFGYQILRKENGEPVAEGETIHICLNREGKPRAIPEAFRSCLTCGDSVK